MEFSYLCCPYSHESRSTRHRRFQFASRTAARIMLLTRKPVFSPVTHGHPIAEHSSDIGSGWDTWSFLDRMLIEQSSTVYVLMLEGWDKSEGVLYEIEHAKNLGIPVLYILWSDSLKEPLNAKENPDDHCRKAACVDSDKNDE